MAKAQIQITADSQHPERQFDLTLAQATHVDLIFFLKNYGDIVDSLASHTGYFRYRDDVSDTSVIEVSSTVVNDTDGTVTVSVEPTDIATSGSFIWEFIVEDASSQPYAFASGNLEIKKSTAANVTLTNSSSTINWDLIGTYTGSLDDPRVKDRVFSFVIENPTASEDISLGLLDANAATITNVKAYAVGSATPTVTLQLQERATLTPNSTGTDILTSSLVADADTQSTTDFDNASIAAGAILHLVTSAMSGTVNQLVVEISYSL